MYKHSKHIAWFLCLIFALLGVEKVSYAFENNCSKMATYCPSASLYTYNILQSTNNKEDSDCNTTKLTNIICETFFINNNPDIELTEQKSTDLFAPFYFKQRIHSTPYITLIDPPPIQSGSLF